MRIQGSLGRRKVSGVKLMHINLMKTDTHWKESCSRAGNRVRYLKEGNPNDHDENEETVAEYQQLKATTGQYFNLWLQYGGRIFAVIAIFMSISRPS